ncbi:GumC family protein [Cyclobacterium jeungdonense]|uniref:non-specific protein-tyrosine kinase n=1 Tax=Cyclobacterium jeungdonense TaxID=708087 RepID=A0ABT8CA51_9BACT|nr:tyrosine-protein kinase [Cyclobacterium jeungdonense]MDN3688889.1 polysaccharide biosynthesis tyrosine autokinase [Cyclobacterium jeungdonense]
MDHSPNSGLFGNQSKDFNLKNLIDKCLQYWYWFVICCFLTVLGAFLHIRYNITPQYPVSTTLLIKEDNTTGSVIAGGISGGMGDYGVNKTIGSEMIVLRSRSLMERVFEELGMNTSYFLEGRVRDVEVFKDDLSISLLINKLDPSAYGKTIKLVGKEDNSFDLTEFDSEGNPQVSNHKFGQEISRPYGSFTVIGSSEKKMDKNIIVYFHDIKNLAKSYSQMLSVELVNKESNVLRLGLTDAVPKRSMLILNKLVEVYSKEAIEDKNQVQLSTIDFLDERIQFLSTELSEVEKNVESYKKENELTDVSSNAELYMQSASAYSKELEDLEIQMDIINSLENYVYQEELKLIPGALTVNDPTLTGLMAKFNELLLERQRMLRSIQPGSSLINNLDEQLNNLRNNIRENLRTIKNNMEITIDNLRSSTRQFQSKVRSVPSIERELLEINRQQSVKQAIYLFLLQSREEAGLALASTQANSRIIDEPAAGEIQVNASKSTLYLAAISLGLLIPFGFIYLKDLLNDKVKERKDVEEHSNVPILGEIYHSKEKRNLQVGDGEHSIIAETFRLVRANLHFANVGKENKVILVTSSQSGDGKTFFSINFGASLAISGKKVVVISFDLRKPTLIKDLGLSDQIGIANFLISDDVSIETLVVSVSKVDNLFAIGAGTLPPNPAELIMSPKVHQLMDELRRRFDFIIVDSPPVGQVADAFSLTSYIDSAIYIVRCNYTRKAQLGIMNDIYQKKKLKHLSVVMNDVKKNNANGYGYGYGYSNGKFHNEKKNLIHQ